MAYTLQLRLASIMQMFCKLSEGQLTLTTSTCLELFTWVLSVWAGYSMQVMGHGPSHSLYVCPQAASTGMSHSSVNSLAMMVILSSSCQQPFPNMNIVLEVGQRDSMHRLMEDPTRNYQNVSSPCTIVWSHSAAFTAHGFLGQKLS